jgi:hypothetical protein
VANTGANQIMGGHRGGLASHMSNISRNGRPEPAFPLYTPEEYTAMHVAFCRAMLRARRRGCEKFVLGIDTRPCTKAPVTLGSAPRVNGLGWDFTE